MQELSIKDLLGILRKWIWLILLVTLIGGLAAGVYYWGFAKDQYTAQTVLYVLQTYQDSTEQIRIDTGASTSFAADYRELLKTEDIREQAAREVGLSGARELEETVKIDINAVTGTRVLNVTVEGEDRYLCADVANVISRIFVDMVSEKIYEDSLATITNARVPLEPSGPPRVRNTLLAALIMGMLCAAVVLCAELFNTRIASGEQVEEGLQRPLLANITDYRKEIGEFLAKKNNKSLLATVSGQTRENIRTLAANIQFAETGHPIRSFTITSVTPSEGKSSVSLLVAEEMASEGKRVLVVDMDFRYPTIGKFLKMRNSKDLVDYLKGNASFEEAILPTDVRNLFFIDSVHTNISLSRVVRSEAFDDFLEEARREFDLVIFDTPPLGMFIDAAILAAKLDGAAMVIADNRVELNNARSVLEQMDKGGVRMLGVVLNYIKPRSMHSYYYGKKYGYYDSVPESKKGGKQNPGLLSQLGTGKCFSKKKEG